MAKKNVEKRKLPYTPEDLSAIEDRLAVIQAQFRDIRQALKDGPLTRVEWTLGTFKLYLGMLEEMLPKLNGEFEAQRTREKMRPRVGTKKESGK